MAPPRATKNVSKSPFDDTDSEEDGANDSGKNTEKKKDDIPRQLVIIDDDENDDENERFHSTENMVDALQHCRPCITPQPDSKAMRGDWEAVQQSHFYIAPEQTDAAKKIFRTPLDTDENAVEIDTDNKMTLECMLLMVSCLRQTCQKKLDKVIKSICFAPNRKNPQDFIGARVICDTWRLFAQERWKERNHSDDTSGTELVLLQYIMLFIKECYVIGKAVQLNVLEEKYGLDWENAVKEATAFAATTMNPSLIQACSEAAQSVQDRQQGRYKAPSSDTTSAAAMPRAATLLSETTKPKMAAAAVAASKHPKADEEDSKKSKENENRRKRMAKLLLQGKAIAGTAASAQSRAPHVAPAASSFSGWVAPRSASPPASSGWSYALPASIPAPVSSRRGESATPARHPSARSSQGGWDASSSGTWGKVRDNRGEWGDNSKNVGDESWGKRNSKKWWDHAKEASMAHLKTQQRSSSNNNVTRDEGPATPSADAPTQRDNDPLNDAPPRFPSSASSVMTSSSQPWANVAIPYTHPPRSSASPQQQQRQVGDRSERTAVAAVDSNRRGSQSSSYESSSRSQPPEVGSDGYHRGDNRRPSYKDDYISNNRQQFANRSDVGRSSDRYASQDSHTGRSSQDYHHQQQQGGHSHRRDSERRRESATSNREEHTRGSSRGGSSYEPDRKRSRSDNPSRVGAGGSVVSAPVGGGSAEAGIGRGRGRTLPAWMTDKPVGGGISGTPVGSNEALRDQRPNGGAGRGRDINKPAWMSDRNAG